MSYDGRYPFGLHGYHRPSPQSKKTHDSLSDPLKVIPDKKSDPLNLWTPVEDDSAARAAEEEARKESLRQRINRMYGIGAESVPAAQPVADDKAVGAIPSTALGPNPEAVAARAAMDSENTRLADATRAYYTDALGRSSEKAQRNTKFRLARQGLLGGSEEVFQQGEVKQDRDLGATRVDEAVRRAISSLTGQREQERLNAINLVNAGSGESAISAAQAGIRNSFENVSNQQKADIFGDLFAGAADARTASNLQAQEALLANRYRERLGSFFNNSGRSTSGRVTPSS